jgi:enoyl-CoA hydratase
MRIEQEHNNTLAKIVFSNEKGLNILSVALLNELDGAWKEVVASGARVCVIRGEGKGFIAGANIKEMAVMSGSQAKEFAALGQGIFQRIESADCVSIAAIHGACLGGGSELALACDIRIGSCGMMIGQPEVNLGLIPGFGGTQRLPRVVGTGWALRMILSGEPITEVQALQIGLITDTGDAADLAARADKLASTILSRGPDAIRLAKKLTRAATENKQTLGLEAEAYAFGQTFESGEGKEGTSAFIEKRAPKF